MSELFIRKVHELLVNAGFNVTDDGYIDRGGILILSLYEYNEESNVVEAFAEYDFNEESDLQFSSSAKHIEFDNISSPTDLVQVITNYFNTTESRFNEKVQSVLDSLENFGVIDDDRDSIRGLEWKFTPHKLNDKGSYLYYNLVEITAKLMSEGHGEEVGAEMRMFYNVITDEIIIKEVAYVEEREKKWTSKPTKAPVGYFGTEEALDEIDQILNNTLEEAEAMIANDD